MEGAKDQKITEKLEHVVCNLCGNDAHQVLFTAQDRMYKNPGEFRYVRCASCGLIYLDPRPAKQEIRKYYPQEYGPYRKIDANQIAILGREEGGFSGLRRRIKEAILAEWYGYTGVYAALPHAAIRFLSKAATALFLPRFHDLYYQIVPNTPGGSLLDVGCGSSMYLLWLKQLGWDVSGVEIDPESAEFIKAQYQIPVYQGDFIGLSLPQNHFDCVKMSHFLEHSYEPLETLQKCRGLLKDSGLLVVSLPNAGCLEAEIFKSDCFLVDAPRHVYQFTPRTLTAMLVKAGFGIERMSYQYLPQYTLGSLEYFFETRNRKVRFPSSWRQNPLVRFLGRTISSHHVMTAYARKRKAP